jgi:membrane-associated phospholipid phosphatase
MVDVPLTLGLGAVLLGIELAAPQLPGPSCGPVCNADTLNALDRTVVGWHSSSARTASNVLIGLNIALPFAFDLLDVAISRPPNAVRGYLEDALILSEVFVVNAALNTAFKYAVRRPRPFMYEPEPTPGGDPGLAPLAEREEVDAGLSFYSQHSSTAFSLATAYSYLFMLRHPGSRLIVPVWLFSEGLAATTAMLRVLAGKHFYTDILLGAVAGSAIGLLIPFVHRRSVPAGSALAQSAWLRSLRVSASPMVTNGGGGLTLSIESP